MTREESIEVIKQDIPCEHDTDLIEALEMAIFALEQKPCKYWNNGKCNGNTEPCDDAISRDAVKELIKSGVSTDTYDDVEQVCKWIDALPSVTQKSGKWIEHQDGS